jgi:tRNA(Ile)-lysidine synthase
LKPPLYTRNKIRLQIMPLLRELNASADGNIARLAQTAHEADEYLKYISDNELKSAEVNGGYDCQRLTKMPPAVRNTALRHLADTVGAPMDHAHTALVTEAMREGGAVDLGGGYTALCAQGILRIITKTDDPAVESTPLRGFPDAIRLQIRDGRIFRGGIELDRQKINSLFLNSLIPCDIITDDTVVRARRAGDTFSDSRRGVTKTVKKLFNELKIPRERRDSILLVANGSTVLWIEGVGCAETIDLSRDQEAILISHPACPG